MIGCTSNQTFLNIVENKLLPNCLITHHDISIADAIFGPNVGSCNARLCTKGLLPSKLPWPTSQHTNHLAAHQVWHHQLCLQTKRAPQFLQPSNSKRGFKIQHMLMDGQFESLRADLADLHISLTTVSADEYVPEIEQPIQTVKERTRCIYYPSSKWSTPATFGLTVSPDRWSMYSSQSPRHYRRPGT
jgi:hypothetical protein